jgi:hypothetical protein
MPKIRSARGFVVALALISLTGQPAVAQNLPSGFKNVNVFDGF